MKRVWFPVIRANSGADVFTERLLAALRRRGVDVAASWFPRGYEFLPEALRWQRIPRGTDVIHANSWNSHVWLDRGIPLVTTVHHLVHDPAYAPFRSTAQATYHRWHVRWREQRAIRHSPGVTAVSNYVARTVRDFSGRQDINVIPNWLETNRYTPLQRTGNTASSSRFRLLLVGNLGRRKGGDLLLPLSKLLDEGFELHCTGGLRGAPPGDAGNIRWLGRLSEADLIDAYQRCDAVISLSRYEGFGYTALEAMACAKPFVGFQTSALSEVVTHGVTGLLGPIDDLETLAANCRLLRSDAELAAAMGQSGREVAGSRFSESAAIDAYLELYERLL